MDALGREKTYRGETRSRLSCLPTPCLCCSLFRKVRFVSGEVMAEVQTDRNTTCLDVIAAVRNIPGWGMSAWSL